MSSMQFIYCMLIVLETIVTHTKSFGFFFFVCVYVSVVLTVTYSVRFNEFLLYVEKKQVIVQKNKKNVHLKVSIYCS